MNKNNYFTYQVIQLNENLLHVTVTKHHEGIAYKGIGHNTTPLGFLKLLSMRDNNKSIEFVSLDCFKYAK